MAERMPMKSMVEYVTSCIEEFKTLARDPKQADLDFAMSVLADAKECLTWDPTRALNLMNMASLAIIRHKREE